MSIGIQQRRQNQPDDPFELMSDEELQAIISGGSVTDASQVGSAEPDPFESMSDAELQAVVDSPPPQITEPPITEPQMQEPPMQDAPMPDAQMSDAPPTDDPIMMAGVGSGRIGPRDTVAGRAVDDVLSAIGSAGETVAREGFGIGKKGFGDVGELAEGVHMLVNPWAGEKDEGGIYDVGSKIAGSIVEKPAETLRALGGVPVEAVIAATDALGITDEDALEKIKTEFRENPLLTLMDVVPMAKFITGAAKTGTAAYKAGKLGATVTEKTKNALQAIPKAIVNAPAGAGAVFQGAGSLISRAKNRVFDPQVVQRTAEATAGTVTGVHAGPLEVIGSRAREGGFFGTRGVAEGFDSIENIGDITQEVADAINAAGKEANARWKSSFGKLKLVDKSNPIDFNKMRQDMFQSLREKHGIEIEGFAQGETRIVSWESAKPAIRDNKMAQQAIEEVIAKMDGLAQRNRGKTLRADTAIKQKRGIKTGRERTYTAQQLHEELTNLRQSTHDRSGTVSLKGSDQVADDMIAIFRGELGKKIDGFNALQLDRAKAFKQTDAMIEAFGFKKGDRRKFESPDILEPTGATKTGIEQLLSSKPTREAQREVVKTFQNFLEQQHGVKLDIEKAVAELRTSTLGAQGIARGGGGGSVLALIGLVGGSGGASLAPIVAGMVLGNPALNAGAFRFLGASQKVIDNVTDFTKRHKQALREQGLETSVIDAMTIGELANRRLESQGDILTQIGENNGND